jgi:hypothetical protein
VTDSPGRAGPPARRLYRKAGTAGTSATAPPGASPQWNLIPGTVVLFGGMAMASAMTARPGLILAALEDGQV